MGLAEKLANNQPLSISETEELRMLFARLQDSNAQVSAMQKGIGSINVSSIIAKQGDFEIPPNNASFVGPDYEVDPNPTVFMQTITTSTVTPITGWETELFTPQSLVVWEDKATGKFKINPNFENLEKTILTVAGNVSVAGNPSKTPWQQQVVFWWYTKTGDVLKYRVPLDVREATYAFTSGSFNQHFNLAELSGVGDLYFKLIYWNDSGRDLGLDMTVVFSRSL